MSLNTDLYSPGIISMIPLFYVGWSDSILSHSEIKLIHERINKLDFLTETDKSYLIHYTDPLNPPSQETFKEWVQVMKKMGSQMDLTEKKSLVELGLEMAKMASDFKSDQFFKLEDSKKALSAIEIALGVEGNNSLGLLMNSLQSNSEPNKAEVLFDVREMETFLDGPLSDLKKRVFKLLRDPFFRYEYEPDKDIYRLKILKQTKALADQGFGALGFPKKYGGSDNKRAQLAILDFLAYHDNSLTIKFGVQFGLFGGAVYGLGTEYHHKKYLERLSKADLLGCFAMTETNHGSNVKGLKTTAIYNQSEDTIIINTPDLDDSKEYIGNAFHSSIAAVFAQLIIEDQNYGVHCILVPIRDSENKVLPGIKIADCGYKIGLNGVDNGKIWFDNVVVPRENLLNKFGTINKEGIYQSDIENANKRFFTMLGALVAGRVSIGAASNSAAKTALTIAIKYALRRRQFEGGEKGQEFLIMDYPSHQERLIPLLARSYAFHFGLNHLADEYANANMENMRKVETDAAGLKALASWHCSKTIQMCREACGGKGYLWENRFGPLKGDTDIFTTFEGDNTVLLQLVAKGLLTSFKENFHNDGMKAVIKYMYDRMNNTLISYNPIYKRNTTVSHILDPTFHKDAFRFREKKLLISVSTRMQSFLKKRLRAFDAFLKCQTHMIELSKAYTERYLLKRFYTAIEICDNKELKIVLTKVYQLFALDTIYENRGWYLENDYLDGSKSKAIRRVREKLIQEIRPYLNDLVASFGIPEEVLSAPIILG